MVDSFFEQGFLHEVCQDYAVHGDNYAIISDGCSNGNGPRIDTDWGARFLCKAAEEHIQEENNTFFLDKICNTAMLQKRLFKKLQDNCLTATLLTLKKEENRASGIVVGDGVIGYKKGKEWFIEIIEFIPKDGKSAAPYYLKYQMFGDTSRYLDEFGGNFRRTQYRGELLDLPNSFENRENQYKSAMDVYVAEGNITSSFYQTFAYEDFDFCFICSDGLQSFFTPVQTKINKYNQPIFVLDVVKILLNFVQFKSGFAKGQRNWAFKQNKEGTFKRLNWINGDDVSVGVIHADI